MTFTDGTGTSHVFTWNSTSSTWTLPPGIHLYLQQLASCGPQVTNARAWQMTRPDRTQFFYDCEGYPTAMVDKDGNEADFTPARPGHALRDTRPRREVDREHRA